METIIIISIIVGAVFLATYRPKKLPKPTPRPPEPKKPTPYETKERYHFVHPWIYKDRDGYIHVDPEYIKSLPDDDDNANIEPEITDESII